METVPTLDEGEAWALLQTLAPDACAADPDAACALARAVGGLPLALTLLGGYLGDEEASLFPDLAAGVLAEMHDPARRLMLASERLGTLDGQKVQLGRVIGLSLEDLPDEATRAFLALGAFAPKPATFDRAAAEAVTEADKRTLARFVKRNLLEWDGATFALHQVLHDLTTYALDPAATERHRAHYLALANADRHDWRRIEAAYPQLQWAWAHLPNAAIVMSYVGALGIYQERRGLWREALDWANRALKVSQEQGSRREEARFLNDLGWLYNALGQRREALGYFERALLITKEVGDHAGLATLLNNLGGVYANLGQLSEALDYHERALLIFEELSSRAELATTFSNIGAVYRKLGKLRKALGYYERAQLIFEEESNRAGLAVTLNSIGALYDSLGQLQKALDYYERALPITKEVGNHAGLATTLNNIGVVYANLRQPREALGYYKLALLITEEVGDRYGERYTRYNIAMLHRAEGRLAEAVAQLRRVVELDEQVEHPDLESDRAMLAQVEKELEQQGKA